MSNWLDRGIDRFRSVMIVVVAGAALVSASSSLFSKLEIAFFGEKVAKPSNLPAKVQTLTASLNTAAQVIGQIEAEIKQRQELVQQLERDADQASKLAALNKDQLDAVAQVLRTEIRSDERQNFWTAQLLAFFYAALGVALSELYRFIMRWRARTKIVN